MLSDEEEFERLLKRSIGKNHRKKIVFSSVFWVALVSFVGLLLLAVVNTVRSTEYTYPYQNGIATYHFNIEDPANPGERFFLNVKLTSILPAVMTHAPMKFEARLIPIGDRTDTTQPAKFYYLILTGSNCKGYGELFRLSDDDTCMMRIYCNAGFCEQHIDSMRYLSSGEFPLYLSTQPGFNGTVVGTGSEHISILPIEVYFANEHTRDGLSVAILAALAFVLVEWWKASKERTKMKTNP
jgi:hypothetical protein